MGDPGLLAIVNPDIFDNPAVATGQCIAKQITLYCCLMDSKNANKQ